MKKTIKLPGNRKNRRLAKRNNAKKHSMQIFVLAAVTTPIHTITAVLDLPDDYANRILRFQEIITACTGNPNVTVPPATLTQANTDLKTYENATTAAARNTAFTPIHNDVKGIMSLFQTAANANVANAIVIIESGKFKVKTITPRQKQQFELHNGLVSGMVHLTAEGGGPHTCHCWRYSPDGTNFTIMIPTVEAHTDKDGLTPGVYAYFTHELITKDGPQGESQIEKIMVK